MPPPPPMEGQRSIMTFFQKAVPATAAVLGSGSAALDASSDASAAATPPSAPPKSGPSALRTKDPLRSSKPERGGTPPAGDPDSEDNVPLRKAPAGLTGSAAPKPANAAGRRDIQTAKGKRKVGPAANNTGGRPTRASKQRAQESLKEKDYSSEELMEKSEEEDGEEGEPGVMTVREKAPVVQRPVANTPGVASSSASARSGRRVRFTIEGEGDSFGGQDSPMLEGAFGGQESPIALDDDEVMCFGDALDTDKQETRREARKVAALKIVEGELAPLAFGTPSEETGGERRIVTSGGKRRRSPPRLEKPRLDGTPKPRGTTVAATKKTGRRASESAGSESAGFKDAHTRRSSRGSEKRGGDEGQGKNADVGEVKGNVFERMKVWKKKEEKKEEAAWEHAIVAMEEKIQNGDDGDVDIEEAEAALKEIGEEEEGQAGEHEEQDGEESEEEMSAYERERLANIKRNNAFLLNLGIDQVQVSETPKPKPGAKKPKRREQSPTTPSSAVRRSTRASSGDAQLKGKMLELESLEEQLAAYRHAGETEDETEELLVQQITQLKEDVARLETENAAKRAKLLEENESARKQGLLGADEVEEEEELHYDDSSVKRYDCEAVRLRVSHADLSNGVSGLAEIEDAAYVDSNLKRIYSISFRPCGKLVAAAGHGGMAGIFGIGNTAGGDGEDVLLSWKAHNGWIGDIQFVSHQKDNQASNLVLSASNDKTVVLWDINTATQKKGGKVVPKNLASGAWHGQGVFSLHEVAGCICTGSKDGSVVFARVGENKLSEVAEFSDVLEGHIVKCCRWREEAPASAPTLFACGGNNHTVRLVDVREGGGRGNGGTVLHAADSAVSFVQWCPADQNILMSCSHDTCIKLWDIRAPRAALHSLQGHHQVPRGARVKGMHRASFFAGGRYVVTTGEKTNLISIYNVATGVAVSRGNADGTGTSCAAFEDGQGCVVAVASASQIALYTPLPSHE